MRKGTFEESARKTAIAYARELRKAEYDFADGAILAFDPREGASAELAVAGLIQQGMSERDAKLKVAKTNRDAKSQNGFAVIAAWYDKRSALGLLVELGGNASELVAWLSAPPPAGGGFFRLVIMSGATASFDVVSYLDPAEA